MKKKFVFIGDTDSINLELIQKSHKLLKKKVKYILIGNIKDIYKYLNINVYNTSSTYYALSASAYILLWGLARVYTCFLFACTM